MSNLIGPKFKALNLEKYGRLLEIRRAFSDCITFQNRLESINWSEPFKMKSKEAREYAIKFYNRSDWNKNLDSLNRLTDCQISPQDVRYPWWNDITLNIHSGNNKKILEVGYSHSYYTQFNQLKPQTNRPLSLISLTETSDKKFVVARKSGAYNGAVSFVPCGALVFNDSSKIILDEIVSKQFNSELGIDLASNEVDYRGLALDEKSGKNYLIVMKTKLSLNAAELDKFWRKCEGSFEFLSIKYLNRKELLQSTDDLLPSSIACLKFI